MLTFTAKVRVCSLYKVSRLLITCATRPSEEKDEFDSDFGSTDSGSGDDEDENAEDAGERRMQREERDARKVSRARRTELSRSIANGDTAIAGCQKEAERQDVPYSLPALVRASDEAVSTSDGPALDVGDDSRWRAERRPH